MSAGHKYKLTYFNLRGRGEIARLIFAAAGQNYEDDRIERDQWPGEFKAKTPFGQMPVLEIDGSIKICQSNAIALYLANEFGLAGKTPIDKARAHMVIECGEDTLKPVVAWFVEKDESKKAELKKKFLEEQLPQFLASFEKILEENNGGNGYFVGDSLTWADIAVMNLCDFLRVAGGDAEFAKHEKLHALIQRVRAVPNIADWLKKRPETQF